MNKILWVLCFSIFMAATHAFPDDTVLRQNENQGRLVTVAIVRDGPSWYFEDLTKKTKEELRLLTHGDFNVVYKEEPAFDAGWDIAKVQDVLKKAMDDPQTDMVITMGVLVTQAATQWPTDLAKPVLAGFIQDADAMGLPYSTEGRSTKHNFSFAVTQHRMAKDLGAFHQMFKVKSIVILVDSKLLEGMKDINRQVDVLKDKLGFGLQLIPVTENADETLSRLDGSVQSVYCTPALRMNDSQWQALIDGMNTRKIATFSMLGHKDVEHGILAGLTPGAADRLARRLALNVQQIVMGASPTELPVFLTLEEKLVINAKTAALIGYSPDFQISMIADFLHREELEKGDPLTLEHAMHLASENNVDLAIKKAEVKGSLQDEYKARSRMFPQAYGNTRYQQIDEDRAAIGGGIIDEKRTSAGIALTQMIFDDPIISRYRAAMKTREGRTLEEESLRMDVLETSGKRFLVYLAARRLWQIETDNLRRTQSNLELARVRQQVGTSGPEDVYRWEAEQAREKSSVLEAQSKMQKARVALNQSLGVDQKTHWKPQDIELADEDFYFLNNRVNLLVQNEAQLEVFRDFMVHTALEESPALKANAMAIKAQKILLGLYRRRWIVPSVSASFTYDRLLDETTGPSFGDQLAAAGIPLSFPSKDDNEWVVALTATFPLFEGGGQFHDTAKAEADLELLKQNRIKAMQLIEQRVQSALFSIESSHPKIQLTRQAADRAHKNLDVVRDKYAQGTVSILNLLDAQNQAYVQDQAAAIAVYDYLQDLVEAQRAISWFETVKSETEKEVWLANFETFMKTDDERGENKP